MTEAKSRSTSIRNRPRRMTRASRDGMWNASSGMMPRGSGEYQRISPSSTAMGNHPLLYADTSSSDGIMRGLAQDENGAARVIDERPCQIRAAVPSCLHDREIDLMCLGVGQDFLLRGPGPKNDLHAEPILLVERNHPPEPLPHIGFHRLMDLRQPCRADLRRPPGRQWILDRVNDMQLRVKGL